MNFSKLAGATGLAASMMFSPVSMAGEPTTTEPRGEVALATAEAKATVKKIDHATREVTLKGEDGEEISFVASDAVRNLAQVEPGDVVTVTYVEALAYEVRKGGATADLTTVVAGKAADPGQKPAGTLARQSTVTVVITAIDPKVPSVTFKGPRGNTRTIKVQHPEKLQGVSVGDTVDIVFTEALALEVEEAADQE